MVYQFGIPKVMHIKVHASLNLKKERHRQIVEALQSEESVSGAIVAILEWYFFEREEQLQHIDNTEVLAAIADLRRDVRRISAMEHRQRLADVAQDEELTDEQKTGLSTEALVALKTKVAKPGMRLEN